MVEQSGGSMIYRNGRLVSSSGATSSNVETSTGNGLSSEFGRVNLDQQQQTRTLTPVYNSPNLDQQQQTRLISMPSGSTLLSPPPSSSEPSGPAPTSGEPAPVDEPIRNPESPVEYQRADRQWRGEPEPTRDPYQPGYRKYDNDYLDSAGLKDSYAGTPYQDERGVWYDKSTRTGEYEPINAPRPQQSTGPGYIDVNPPASGNRIINLGSGVAEPGVQQANGQWAPESGISLEMPEANVSSSTSYNPFLMSVPSTDNYGRQGSYDAWVLDYSTPIVFEPGGSGYAQAVGPTGKKLDPWGGYDPGRGVFVVTAPGHQKPGVDTVGEVMLGRGEPIDLKGDLAFLYGAPRMEEFSRNAKAPIAAPATSGGVPSVGIGNLEVSKTNSMWGSTAYNQDPLSKMWGQYGDVALNALSFLPNKLADEIPSPAARGGVKAVGTFAASIVPSLFFTGPAGIVGGIEAELQHRGAIGRGVNDFFIKKQYSQDVLSQASKSDETAAMFGMTRAQAREAYTGGVVSDVLTSGSLALGASGVMLAPGSTMTAGAVNAVTTRVNRVIAVERAQKMRRDDFVMSYPKLVRNKEQIAEFKQIMEEYPDIGYDYTGLSWKEHQRYTSAKTQPGFAEIRNKDTNDVMAFGNAALKTTDADVNIRPASGAELDAYVGYTEKKANIHRNANIARYDDASGVPRPLNVMDMSGSAGEYNPAVDSMLGAYLNAKGVNDIMLVQRSRTVQRTKTVEPIRELYNFGGKRKSMFSTTEELDALTGSSWRVKPKLGIKEYGISSMLVPFVSGEFPKVKNNQMAVTSNDFLPGETSKTRTEIEQMFNLDSKQDTGNSFKQTPDMRTRTRTPTLQKSVQVNQDRRRRAPPVIPLSLGGGRSSPQTPFIGDMKTFRWKNPAFVSDWIDMQLDKRATATKRRGNGNTFNIEAPRMRTSNGLNTGLSMGRGLKTGFDITATKKGKKGRKKSSWRV